jgi:hypothetical protein
LISAFARKFIAAGSPVRLSIRAEHRPRRCATGALLGMAAGWPLVAHAQAPTKVPRIGVLFYGSPGRAPEIDAFRQGSS